MSDPDPAPAKRVPDLDATRPPSEGERHAGTIGPYQLLRKVGEGGMGEVWLADQTRPVQRQVAVKVIKAGMDTAQVVARFEAERQALAMMDHPAIAKVFDGGTTPDGRPYFVMEYVRGEPITDYCDRMTLPLRDRLELFASLCDGVQHAHQKGVIHRDLKPSNVLVTVSDDRATPRIIDFGIAKATARRLIDKPFFTEVGGFVGTPEYMSPEQADPSELDVDTRTDVYSLGVILYELLVGTLPHDREALRAGGIDHVRRVLFDEDPRKPSMRVDRVATAIAGKRRLPPTKLVQAVRGDLDWVTLKALERDRTRRYPTANALALDVRRHLANEPVSAGPPTTRYKVGKFVRRHVVGVASAAAAILGLLVFTAVLAFQAERLAVERDRANQEAATATQVTQFLISLFNVSDPGEARGNSLTAREALDTGAERLDRTLRDQPLVRVRLATAIGTVYTNLGLYSAGQPLLERAVEVARAAAGDDHPDTVAAMNALAAVFWYRREWERSIELYQRVFDALRKTLGESDRSTLRAKFDLSSAYQGAMALPEAERLLRATLEAQRITLGADDPDTLSSLNNLQGLYFQMKRYEEALPIASEVLERETTRFGPDHPRVLLSTHNLGAIYLELKQLGQAESLLLRALDGRRKVLGRHHDGTLTTWERYARVLEERGDASAAREAYRGILAEINGDTQVPYPSMSRSVLEHLLQLAEGRPSSGEVSEWRRQLDALVKAGIERN